MIFYVYNSRKRLGYIYLEDRKLWHKVDRFSIRRFFTTWDIIEEDIRPKLDKQKNLIPLGYEVYNVKTRELSSRLPDHYFTYFLEYPRFAERRVMDSLFENPADAQKVRKFIKQAIKGSSSRKYLPLKGNGDALFRILSQLHPLITFGQSCLYCEEIAKSSAIELCESSRLVLCNVGDRTIRIASPARNQVTQYSALVLNNSDRPDNIIIKSVDYDETREPDASEVLFWILGRSFTSNSNFLSASLDSAQLTNFSK